MAPVGAVAFRLSGGEKGRTKCPITSGGRSGLLPLPEKLVQGCGLCRGAPENLGCLCHGHARYMSTPRVQNAIIANSARLSSRSRSNMAFLIPVKIKHKVAASLVHWMGPMMSFVFPIASSPATLRHRLGQSTPWVQPAISRHEVALKFKSTKLPELFNQAGSLYFVPKQNGCEYCAHSSLTRPTRSNAGYRGACLALTYHPSGIGP
jgi:hypothetical protein